MSKHFPINPEDQPIDVTDIKATEEAWQADADRFVTEELPLVGNAIQRVRDGTETLNRVIGLIEEVIPIFMGMGGSAASVPLEKLNEARAACSLVKDNLGLVQGFLPGLASRMKGLLG